MAHVRIIINVQVGERIRTITTESASFDEAVADAVRSMAALTGPDPTGLREGRMYPMPPIAGTAT